MGLCLFSRVCVCVCVCVCVWGALSRLSSGQWQGMAHRQQDRVLHATTKAQTGFPGDAGEGDMYDGDVGADMSSAAAAGAGMLQKRLRDSLNRMKEQQCLISNPYPRKCVLLGCIYTHVCVCVHIFPPMAPALFWKTCCPAGWVYVSVCLLWDACW